MYMRVLPQVRGLINGAAMVYFAFIGFDAVACSAEEVRVCASTCLASACPRGWWVQWLRH